MTPYRIARLRFIPFLVRRALYHCPDAISPEQELMQNIVGRAIMDALGFTGCKSKEYSEHNNAVRSARAWFKFAENVDDLFELAGIMRWKEIRRSVGETRPVMRYGPGEPRPS